MSYIKKSLSKDESVKHLFNYCWLIKVKIIFCYTIFVFLALKFFLITHGSSLLVLIFPALYHLKFSTTEMGTTNKRIIIKQGILTINTQEQLLKKIETIDIQQTLVERLCATATIKITGTGSNVLLLKNIAHPIEAKKSIENLL